MIRGIQSKAIFEIGEELQAAHDELAKCGYGHFEEWCNSVGFTNRMQVKRILDYHDLIVTNCYKRDFLESLPKSLVYEVAKKSAPQELKQAVLDGKIKTLKDGVLSGDCPTLMHRPLASILIAVGRG